MWNTVCRPPSSRQHRVHMLGLWLSSDCQNQARQQWQRAGEGWRTSSRAAGSSENPKAGGKRLETVIRTSRRAMRIKKVGTMKLVLGKESDQCHRPWLPARSLMYRYCHTVPCSVLYPAYHPLSSWSSQLVLQAMPKCNHSTLKSTKTCSAPSSSSSEKHNLRLVHQASPSASISMPGFQQKH